MWRKRSFRIRQGMLEEFTEYLSERENAESTIRKYNSDLRNFLDFMGAERKVTKEKLIEYKGWLGDRYAVNSANSMLAALNQFLDYFGMGQWKVRRFKVQKQCFCSGEKEMTREEYERLRDMAQQLGKERLAMIIETIAGTGIRISELSYFTVKAIEKGQIRVRNKGKDRVILIPKTLRLRLLYYIRKNGLREGAVFCTKSGRPENRSNIWKEMKWLANAAGIKSDKVFPHNFRHLFARTFYNLTRDIVGLADMLGHSNIEVTRIYAREGEQYYQKKIDEMGMTGSGYGMFGENGRNTT